MFEKKCLSQFVHHPHDCDSSRAFFLRNLSTGVALNLEPSRRLRRPHGPGKISKIRAEN